MYELHDIEERLHPSERMPVLFVGHGSPMNAIEDNIYSRTWASLGRELPHPQAIIVMSAHWLTRGGTSITDAPRNRVIYDFGGFPEPLYHVRYDTAGDHDVARIAADRLVDWVQGYEIALDRQWGLDHGTWSVLRWLAPHPDVPVLQISIDYSLPLPRLHELFGRLRRLRDRGVLFIGSGNIVHALRSMRGDGAVWDWAREFDEVAEAAIRERDLGTLLDPFRVGTAARLAVPTDDHYRPMIAAMALLHPGEELRFFNESIDLGAISMRSFITA